MEARIRNGNQDTKDCETACAERVASLLTLLGALSLLGYQGGLASKFNKI